MRPAMHSPFFFALCCLGEIPGGTEADRPQHFDPASPDRRNGGETDGDPVCFIDD